MQETEAIDLGEMKKRRVIMADGKRYLIYYTFEKDNASKTEMTAAEPANLEVSENV